MPSALPETQIHKLLPQIPDWSLSPDKKAIFLSLKMKDFMAAITLLQQIAVIAEKADHHPDLHLTGYRNLRIELSTHDIGGLSPKDFALASQIDSLPKELKQ